MAAISSSKGTGVVVMVGVIMIIVEADLCGAILEGTGVVVVMVVFIGSLTTLDAIARRVWGTIVLN